MSAGASPDRLPSVVGTAGQIPEPYRIPVRTPDGKLAFNATADQERRLRAEGAVSEVRSPTGILRYLKLHRSFRERDAQFRWHLGISAGAAVMQAQRLT